MRFVYQHGRWLLTAAAFLPFIAFALFFFLRRKPLSPDELERLRRARLNRVGRITAGQIIGFIENSPEPSPARARGASLFRPADSAAMPASAEKLLCYVYSVSGVRYETAQNVTGLEHRVRFSHMAAGLPASVKYDPASPGNSILIADDWSGLA